MSEPSPEAKHVTDELKRRTNIHEYLERIGAKPPGIDIKLLGEAKKRMIWCNSIEEAVDVIEKLDKEIELC